MYPVSPIRIQYKAGLKTDSPPVECAADIKLAVLLIASAMFVYREPEIELSRAAALAAPRINLPALIGKLTVHTA
jgi:hypothetical protein